MITNESLHLALSAGISVKLSIILESTQNGIEVNGPTSKQGKTTFFSVIFDDQVIDCIEPLNLFVEVDN